MDAALQMGSHKGRISPCWSHFFWCSSGYIWLSGLHLKMQLLAHVQPLTRKNPQALLRVLPLFGIALTWVQHFALGLVEHHGLLMSPLLSLSRSLDSIADLPPEVCLWYLPQTALCPGLKPVSCRLCCSPTSGFFCLEISCGPPAHVENALIRGSFYQYGDMVTYSCYSGYMLEGPLRSICLENGTWTTPPTCKGKSFFYWQNDSLICHKHRGVILGVIKMKVKFLLVLVQL